MKTVNTPFGPIIEDDRVPPNEVWMYSHDPIEVIAPCGHKELRKPDHKIVNIGGEDGKTEDS